ncbi:hypothetical protein MLD38_015271 [Melastoma candidum]|uniref:Uncharacterized protein n=1 Tax=Melastoma candidum TaxID=119954 RepID=A0ACB9RFN2_9MYRT|nr:hypothetical protein MLD38_015271 [Melastoma candidum]
MKSAYSFCDHAKVSFLIALLPVFFGFTSPFTIVENLPGFHGRLPFYLETGYVGVGGSNESQLFYYFVESQRSPSQDPLLLWLAGGPGCSALSAFFYGNGPLAFTYVSSNGSLPTLHLNPFTWTQGLNVLYVDAPVGTGFSYSTTEENYFTDDYKSAYETYEFLQKWLTDHPQYQTNVLYIGGDTYSGITLPITVQKIFDGNDAGVKPLMKLRGYVLGNPNTDDYIDGNARVPFARRLTLISDELYEDAKESCGGNYVEISSNNTACVQDMDEINELLQQINMFQVLEPICPATYTRPVEVPDGYRRILEDNRDDLLDQPGSSTLWCRDYNYVPSSVWANDENVRVALGIRNGTKGMWERCNGSLAYTKTVTSSIHYHENFTNTNLRALIYSGDHDMSVTNPGTQTWLGSIGMTLSDTWRAWYVDGQVAGYTEEYSNDGFTLYYATVKATGHVALEYKPKECYLLLDRWLAFFPF